MMQQPTIVFFDIMGVLLTENLTAHNSSLYDIIAPMRSLIPLIKSRGIKISTLSNCSAQRWQTISTRFPELFDQFDFHIHSHAIGHKKPNPAIFASASSLTTSMPHESLFIDDNEENCVAAAALGFATVVCRDHEDTAARVRLLLNL